MRHKRTETREVEVVYQVDCDLCGQQIRSKIYDVDEVTITHECGQRFPDGGHLEIFDPDICSKCWVEKVLPALRAIGLNTQYRENSW
jgi:hypothetical protein